MSLPNELISKVYLKEMYYFIKSLWYIEDFQLKNNHDILNAVSFISGISIEDIKGKRRKQKIVDARVAYLKIAHELKNTRECTDSKITRLINRRHCTKSHHMKYDHKEIRYLINDVLKYYDI